MSNRRNGPVDRNGSGNAALLSFTPVTRHEEASGHAIQLSPGRPKRSGSTGFIPAAEPGDKLQMQKEIGLFSGVSIIAGIIIGSGIFLTPAGVVKHAGSTGMSIIVWILCGLLSTVGAICYAELGTAIPRSGGDYEYIREGLGNLPSFVYLWTAIVTILPAGNAVIALTFAENILQPIMPKPEEPSYGSLYDWTVRMLAFLCISILMYINCRNVRLVTRVQTFFTIAKLAALVFIIVAGLIYLVSGREKHDLATPFKGTNDVGKVAMSFYFGLFSYSGWNYLNFLTEEIQQPRKNLPRAIYISLPLVTTVYVLANVAYFAVLPVFQIADSTAPAVLFTKVFFGGHPGTGFLSTAVMPILIAFSCFGAVNGTLLSSSRLFFIGARNGHLPDMLALVNMSHLTPIPAILCVGFLSILLLFVSNVNYLLNIASVVECLSQASCIFTLLYLRYKRPDMERPIRVNILLPYTFLIVALFLFFASAFEDFFVVLLALGIILAGIPVYCIMFYAQRNRMKRESSKDSSRSAKSGMTCFVQKLTFAAQEEQ